MNICKLPPNVDGVLCGQLRLHVPFLLWSSYHQDVKDNVKIEVEFWGQQHSRTLTPFFPGAGKHLPLDTLLEYNICCSLDRFQQYLTDMGSLELVVSCHGTPVGSSQVTSLHTLSACSPIAGLYPIICHNGFGHIGEIFLSLSIWSCHKIHARNTRTPGSSINNSQPHTIHSTHFLATKKYKEEFDCQRYSNCLCNRLKSRKYQMKDRHLLPCKKCHHCPVSNQHQDDEREMSHGSILLQQALAKLLERAVKLRDKNLVNVTSQRSYHQTQPQVRLENLVESVFKEDSSPEESLLEALFFPASSKVNTASSCSTLPNPRTENSRRNNVDFELHTDSKSSQTNNRLLDSHLLSAPNSLKIQISKSSDSNRLHAESRQHEHRTLKNQNKNQTSFSTHKKSDTNTKSMCNNFNGNLVHDYVHIRRTDMCDKSSRSSHRDLRVTVVTLQLTDSGLKLLGQIPKDWIFSLEMKVPVLKGFGVSIWNQRGHRQNSDLNVLQFISCLHKEGVVTFNQEKILESVDKEQAAEMRIDVKDSHSHQRRCLGSCVLSLKDLCDAQVILPVTTVQPNAQLSLKVHSVDASSVSRNKFLSQVTQTHNISHFTHGSLENKWISLSKESLATHTVDKYSQPIYYSDVATHNKSITTSIITAPSKEVNLEFHQEPDHEPVTENQFGSCAESIEKSGAVNSSKGPSPKVKRGVGKSVKVLTLFIEKAQNLPEGIACAYITFCVDASHEVKSDLSHDYSWNFYHDVALDLSVVKKLHFKLWRTDTVDVTLKSSCDTLIGTADVTLDDLLYLPRLSGWYTLHKQGTAVGQLKINIWPRVTLPTAKESKYEEEEMLVSQKSSNDARNEITYLCNHLEPQTFPGTKKKLPVNEFIKKSLQRLKK